MQVKDSELNGNMHSSITEFQTFFMQSSVNLSKASNSVVSFTPLWIFKSNFKIEN
jgi:hypothetical protein